ncbi:hypothetical protein yc1106_08432 [Curvularia clavata]|uniref:Uncharacterized protein n=1 Tax=Curvularia clavata TaxID=95742 RepID=A0A9Q9DUL5_CURCL|nr:hypothetical protein yc1106_08432 [Curvularia clavata]
MAGRILPVALAAVIGVSIGVATFDGEFKKQRLARMEEEYQRELAAAAASKGASPAPVPVRQLQARQEEPTTSVSSGNSWSNMLGLWAWKKDPVRETVSLKDSNEDTKGKP